MKKLVIFIVLATSLLAQTTPQPGNIVTVIPGGVILGIHPTTGAFVTIKLDSSVQLVANNNGELVLTVTAPASRIVRGFLKVGATPVASITLPSVPRSGVDISVSGFSLAEVEDFTRNGAVITFISKWAPQTGVIIRWTYEE